MFSSVVVISLRKSLIETLNRIEISSFKSIKSMSTGKEFQICAAKYLSVLLSCSVLGFGRIKSSLRLVLCWCLSMWRIRLTFAPSVSTWRHLHKYNLTQASSVFKLAPVECLEHVVWRRCTISDHRMSKSLTDWLLVPFYWDYNSSHFVRFGFMALQLSMVNLSTCFVRLNSLPWNIQ